MIAGKLLRYFIPIILLTAVVFAVNAENNDSTAAECQQEVTCSSAYKEYTVRGVYTKTVSADLDGGNYVYAVNKLG